MFDIQHAVLPTRLSIKRFYEELVETQRVLNRKHLGWVALKQTARTVAGHLLHGQTNFLKALWQFNKVYDPRLQLADHSLPVQYQLAPPAQNGGAGSSLFVHQHQGRRGRSFDDSTEQFVNQTRTQPGRANVPVEPH